MAVLVLLGATAWLTQTTGSGTSVANAVVPSTLAASGTAAQDEDAAVSVSGHREDAHYWEGPLGGPGVVGDERMELDYGWMEMSDERLSGDVIFIHNGDAWENTDPGMYLFWGSMLIENDGGTWQGTHFAADHHSQPGMHGPIVMQLTGSGDYEWLSAILYRTVISDPADELEESVDGMIFPGDLPPGRT